MRAFYNDIERFACDWMQNLMDAGLITPGVISDKSIANINPDELVGFNRVHFFAGIAGWELALNLAGWGETECWTGSCPCQPFSAAGQQKGHVDERHLWPAFHNLITECKPPVVFGEQVASALGREWLAGVRADLEADGYACGAADLCAAGAGAPHIRQRLFWVAGMVNATSERRGEGRPEHGIRSGRPAATFAGGISGVADAHVSEQGRGQQRLHTQDGSGDWPASVGERSDALMGHAESLGRRGWQDGQDGGRGQRSSADTGEGSGVALGDAFSPRLERHTRHVDDGNQSGRIGEIEDGSTAAASSDSIMADANGGRHPRQWVEEHTGIERASRHQPFGHHQDWRQFWSDAELRVGADGKSRRVPRVSESRICSVADGLSGSVDRMREDGFPLLAKAFPNRVGLLRGYGNAIVAPLAAEFVRAVMEIHS